MKWLLLEWPGQRVQIARKCSLCGRDEKCAENLGPKTWGKLGSWRPRCRREDDITWREDDITWSPRKRGVATTWFGFLGLRLRLKHWQAVVNFVMSRREDQNTGNCLTNWESEPNINCILIAFAFRCQLFHQGGLESLGERVWSGIFLTVSRAHYFSSSKSRLQYLHVQNGQWITLLHAWGF
jgi:hypothetical protein